MRPTIQAQSHGIASSQHEVWRSSHGAPHSQARTCHFWRAPWSNAVQSCSCFPGACSKVKNVRYKSKLSQSSAVRIQREEVRIPGKQKHGKYGHIWKETVFKALFLPGLWGTRFAVWAPSAHSVSLVGDFNFWDSRAHPMFCREKFGVWEIFLPKWDLRGSCGAESISHACIVMHSRGQSLLLRVVVVCFWIYVLNPFFLFKLTPSVSEIIYTLGLCMVLWLVLRLEQWQARSMPTTLSRHFSRRSSRPYESVGVTFVSLFVSLFVCLFVCCACSNQLHRVTVQIIPSPYY